MTAPVRRRPVLRAVPDPVVSQRAGRRRLLRRAAIAVLLVVLAVVAFRVTMTSRLLSIQRVDVTGVHRLSAAEARAAAGVRLGSPLAQLDVAAVRRRVAALPEVAGLSGVRVSRKWPRTVLIIVTERTAVAAVAQPDGGWQLVDRTGTGFGEVPALPAGLIGLRVDASTLKVASTRAAVAVLQGLPEPLQSRVAEVSVATPEQVTLLLKDRRTVLWGSAAAGPTKAAAVLALLTRPQQTIDVTSPRVVVVH